MASIKTKNINFAPLADRMRPGNLQEFVGQNNIIGKGTVLRALVENGHLTSLIFWGPPGCGKTTLGFCIAKECNADFISMSAVMAGKEDLKSAIERAEQNQRLNQKTILLIDEIHRWNKAQQDALLPYVEKGVIILIGATTENPSFEVNSALLSRSRVFLLSKLSSEELGQIIQRALQDDEKGLGRQKIILQTKASEFLKNESNGDARVALNTLEMAAMSVLADKNGERNVRLKEVVDARQHKTLLYDKAGEEHYNIISALHKSMRGSDPNAAFYWLVRMLEAGEDPLYVARRIIRFASEDVGNAAPYGLVLAVAAYQACHFVGMPECNLALAQAVDYLTRAKKSNALYVAYSKVSDDIKQYGALPTPLHIRNAPTALMKDLGYGKGYIYNPEMNGPVKQKYLPEELRDANYFN